MKPLIDSLPKFGGGCRSCGDNSEAIKTLMENKTQPFVVQVVVEAIDGIGITRELLGQGKVLSVMPYKQQQAQVNITNQHQTSDKRVFPQVRQQPVLNG